MVRRQMVALAVVLLAQLAVPAGPLRAWSHMVFNLVAAAAVVAGVRRHRPHHRAGWYALACSLLAFSVSALGWATSEQTWPLEVAAKSVGHVAALVAAVAILRARRPGHDVDALLDGTAAFVAGGLLIRQWLAVAPVPVPPVDLQRAGEIFLALVMLAAVTVGVRLASNGRRSSIALLSLLAAAGMALIGNLPLALWPTAAAPRVLDLFWLAAAGLIGLAALHPSMCEVGQAESRTHRSISVSRMLALGSALLVNPLLVSLWAVRRTGDELLAAGVAALTVLVLVRLGRVITEREAMRLALLREVEERRATEAQLAHLALYDTLTGLANRALLMDRLSAALDRAARDSGAVAVLFCDLDGFKQVNDRHGHDVGDQLLIEVARRWESVLRDTDTLARLAGDEFVVVCEGLDSRTRAEVLAVRLLDQLREPVQVDGPTLDVSCSVGVALADANDSPRELLRRADTAMYRVKRKQAAA